MSLASEILADAPLRFYKLGDAAAPVADLGSAGVTLPKTSAPAFGSVRSAPAFQVPGGIPSAPAEKAIHFDGLDDNIWGPGTNVALAGISGAGNVANPWAIMCVCKLDPATASNAWWYAEGSTVNNTPIIGFQTADAAGRIAAWFRAPNGGGSQLRSALGVDLRNQWLLLHFECDPTDAATGVRFYVNGTLVNSGGVALAYASGTPGSMDTLSLANLERISAASYAPVALQYGATFDHPLGQTRVSAHYAAFLAAAAGGFVDAASLTLDGDGALAGAGATLLAGGANLTAESETQGIGASILAGLSAMSGDADLAGAGSLILPGAGALAADAELAGAGEVVPLAHIVGRLEATGGDHGHAAHGATRGELSATSATIER